MSGNSPPWVAKSMGMQGTLKRCSTFPWISILGMNHHGYVTTCVITAPLWVWYVPIPCTGTVLVVKGVVLNNPTHTVPMQNPSWVRRYTLTRMTTQDPSMRTLQPYCTCPLKD